MSNELQIENIEQDNMDGEIHKHPQCDTESREWTYTDGQGRTLNLCIIFMVCHCRKKSTNPLAIFEQNQSLNMGECVDPHLSGRNCSYKRYSHYSKEIGHCFIFERKCYCRNKRRGFSPWQ